MYLGSYKIDFSGKNRLILPRKWRRELGNEERFWVFLGQNGEIWGFDQINWQNQARGILEIPLSSVEGRVERLKFFPQTDECILDGQGRFILPQEIAERANLKGQILMVGAGDHFEIWDLKEWEKYQVKLNF
jgi:MraZ protein